MKCIIQIFIYIICGLTTATCRNNSNPNRVYFSIDSTDRKIIIPIQFNDSITANMVFDTGWNNKGIDIDSHFAELHPSLIPDMISDSLEVGSQWGGDRVLKLSYHVPESVKIDNVSLTYNAMNIFNYKKALSTNLDGTFNIPVDDSTHVWEFNFEQNYLEIQPIKNYQRVVNPNHRRFYFSKYKTIDGRFLVDMVADYKNNPYKTAGLQKGDEIISYNGFLLKDITEREALELDKQDTLIVNIIRKGELKSLIVPIDKAKDRGD